MGKTAPRAPAAQAKKRSTAAVGAATILTFVVLLYFVELIDQMTRHSLDANGIRPLEVDGLWGIVFSPLLHASWEHLMANTVPLLVLGFLMTLAGLSRFVWATAIVWILGGFGTWLIGDVGSSCGPTDHIGASGLIFGWLAFLLVFGIFVRRVSNIIIGLVVMFAYGGVLLGAMPVLGVCGGVSWQGHLCGAIAGVAAAYWLSAPERKARTGRTAGATPSRPKT
ncbi:rhomboid family intramembrane serine protease [Mycobacterium marseillense]|uniref:Rhomboid family intramembrane serine protease n=1 Tax=Mycobacterium marseillense TaxID=701042 RepID=A0AAC9YJC5_9MYCO|nr:rhomboid family intramembrane serine protease [Mycobacterium marseillense]ASW89632.1 rhomboid family intramembrane serine protease [Mycobacterium marseillense]MCA2262990.1 rhomboid family intramembrane serine protease [Mycobacterium marseillense]MCV7405404.1 rhomboid family intramembrane serine protease [Mycobacterium marseillense]OBJ72366.1 rhomboid family intramembrane serine protease [Mycobacterium marseillense]ORA95752.1 rhomboid family intramembrane serine protease [Mycobacterium marse